VSATLTIFGLSIAAATNADTAFRRAVRDGIAAVLGVDASRVAVTRVYAPGAARLLRPAGSAAMGGASTIAAAVGARGAQSASGVAVDFTVLTTAGASSALTTALSDALTDPAAAAAAPYAAALSTLVSTVASATGVSAGALGVAVDPATIDANPVVLPAAVVPAAESGLGLSTGAIAGIVVGAVVGGLVAWSVVAWVSKAGAGKVAPVTSAPPAGAA
jgi:hypothetical protein